MSRPNRTGETLKEFDRLSKEDRSRIKDVGGYVGGYLHGGRRSPQNVVSRSLITLDIDFGHLDFWDTFTLIFDCAALLHSTHSHRDNTPKYRLIIPANREISPDEYQAVGRRIAGDLGIEFFDNTTFETNRLMFWPSCSSDAVPIFEVQQGEFLNVDEVLATYKNWKDSSLWPTSQKVDNEMRATVDKQQDPTEKSGLIGAFCRAYSITDALNTLLIDEYTDAHNGRYTYVKGSTAAGLVVYDDLFAYSHHGTSPSSGKLCNAFDLVRLHLFGHLDERDSYVNNPPSFKAMEDFARKDERVKMQIAEENLAAARLDFADDTELEGENTDWMRALEVDGKGNFESSATNLKIVFDNDPRLKGKFKRNNFDTKAYVFPGIPWRKITTPEPMRDVDLAGVRSYIEQAFGISSKQKVDDAMLLALEAQSFHPVREYLSGLVWDGKQRIDNLLTDYLGVEPSDYTREAIRKPLTAAVARIFNPGAKFDLVLTLVGPQGSMKSSFIDRLGGAWYSDTFTTVSGKDAFEQLQGFWIIEIAELAGLRKAEVESIKHFISKREDSFRAAYARMVETHKRQCIFIGTTNDNECLSDPTGNRRFLPVDVVPENATRDVFKDLPSEVDQIWAEAVALYRAGETLYLSKDVELAATIQQAKHTATDERTGIVEAYLNKALPPNWQELNIDQRRAYVNDEASDFEDSVNFKGATEVRDIVCVAEIWCECLGYRKEDMDKYKTRSINSIMKTLSGWVQTSSTTNFPIYGTQKFYKRKSD